MMDGSGDAQGQNDIGDSFFAGGQVGLEGEDSEHIGSGDNEEEPGTAEPLREQDRFLPIANVARIMKKSIPQNGKIAKDAKECVQECVSEFISFITSEASERCHQEKRKTINGEDILFAMSTLGFDSYVEPLKLYLQKYREAMKGEKSSISTDDMTDLGVDEPFQIQSQAAQALATNILDPSQQGVIYTTTTFANQPTLQQINFAGLQS